MNIFIDLIGLGQGGPTSFFPRAKNIFSVGPKDQETYPGTIFKTNSQLLLCLTHRYHIRYMSKYKCYKNMFKLL
jgi:hypothetical protein